MVRESPTRYDGRLAEPIVGASAELEKLWQLSWYEKATLKLDEAINLTKLGVRLTPVLFRITKGIVMRDWKTTVAGVVKAIFSVLTILGVSTGNITEALITAVLVTVADLVQAWLTPDKK